MRTIHTSVFKRLLAVHIGNNNFTLCYKDYKPALGAKRLREQLHNYAELNEEWCISKCPGFPFRDNTTPIIIMQRI